MKHRKALLIYGYILMNLAWFLCGIALIHQVYPAAVTSGLVGISMLLLVSSIQTRTKVQNTDKAVDE